MKKLLFVTWDGPQTRYMEGLFMPIYARLQAEGGLSFHVLQFTWGDANRVAETRAHADALGIAYTSFPILRKPHPALGSLLTLYRGYRFLKQYIATHQIDVVMPRSTFPAILVNRLPRTGFQVLFDADGLPIEERVDFSGLSPQSRTYRWFKAEERRMLLGADVVITRSQAAIAVHLQTLGEAYRSKFHVVYNGRDAHFFSRQPEQALSLRKALEIPADAFVFVYCGSLGPQYGWEAMQTIFARYRETQPNAYFLILTGNTEFAIRHTPASQASHTLIRSVPFAEVPAYLSLAQVAFALREPKPSMRGVAPIKLGEYLLMGLPTIASRGIGDTEDLLRETPHCFLWDAQLTPPDYDGVLAWLQTLSTADPTALRATGLQYFTLEQSVASYQKAFHSLFN
ncbi:glycosyltransferase [Flavobacterium sp.]|uniref:glycosyltransferase n=1 Tax=Flavobacterium sp. TaxID=239 RepID=UPI002FD88EEA